VLSGECVDAWVNVFSGFSPLEGLASARKREARSDADLATRFTSSPGA
jgi:hypothetical protein